MEKNNKPKYPRKNDQLKALARYSGLTFQMLAIILLGLWGGRMLDKYIPLKFPVFTIVLLFLSVILSMYWVIKDLLKK